MPANSFQATAITHISRSIISVIAFLGLDYLDYRQVKMIIFKLGIKQYGQCDREF